ncbi:hypothetical protein ACIO3O_36045 [Streptomyces sp. NPDC087440]|uniref:hypothetical protein n=1 Tax=Streptomyces sp. NPDC087440 TaxID=3365790 RepID=UPI0037FC94F9
MARRNTSLVVRPRTSQAVLTAPTAPTALIVLTALIDLFVRTARTVPVPPHDVIRSR